MLRAWMPVAEQSSEDSARDIKSILTLILTGYGATIGRIETS